MKSITRRLVIATLGIGCFSAFGWFWFRDRHERRQRLIHEINTTAGLVMGDLETVWFSTDASPEAIEHALRKLKVEGSPQRYLLLSQCQVTPEACRIVGELRWIRTLGVNMTSITDDDLHEFRGLHRLYDLGLTYTNITDAGLEHLTALKSLKRLAVEGTKVTEEGLRKLKESLPKLDLRNALENLRHHAERQRENLLLFPDWPGGATTDMDQEACHPADATNPANVDDK